MMLQRGEKLFVNALAGVVAFLLAVAYPFVIYAGLTAFSLRHTAIIVLMLALLRVVILSRSPVPGSREYLPILLIITSVIAFSAVFQSEGLLRLNPAIINILLLIYFASTFRAPQTLVERIARNMRGEPFPEEAVRYCRVINFLWCLFFFGSASVALWSAFYSSREFWVFLTGVLYWLALGSMFAFEWIFRRLFMEPIFRRSEEKMMRQGSDEFRGSYATGR